MTALIIIGIYLVGYVLSYLIFKYSPQDDGTKVWQFQKPEDYTIGDRFSNLKLSFFSWLVVLIWIILVGNDILPKPKDGWWQEYLNKPAKW